MSEYFEVWIKFIGMIFAYLAVAGVVRYNYDWYWTPFCLIWVRTFSFIIILLFFLRVILPTHGWSRL